MKRLNHILMLLAATAALLTGCHKDDEEIIPELKIENSTLTIGAAQDSRATVTFEVNVNWTATVSYEGETSDWLTLGTTNGKAGKIELQLTAAANPLDAIRQARITIFYNTDTYSNNTHHITIIQENRGTIDITTDFDPDFAKLLQEKGRIADATHITLADVKSIEYLNIDATWEDHNAGKGLTSLKGIEYFESLIDLSCYCHQLTTLDISKNTKLTSLYCRRNQLTTLDVSKNAALTELGCSDNKLTTLDVSKNTALTGLNCGYNKLTTLDVSKNTALTYLHCDYNQFTTLNVSKNTALTSLYCSDNKLTTLDVSKNTELTTLQCYNNKLTTLNVSNCTKLTSLNCFDNKLTTLNVSNCTKLTSLYCSDNQLTTLDVSKNTALAYLYCENNQLTTLDVSNCTKLTTLVHDPNIQVIK